MDQTRSEPQSIVAILCMLTAVYGIGFGVYMIPTGLFVGPHIFVAAVVHIAMGAAFLIAGSEIRRKRASASALAGACAVITCGIGLAAVYHSLSAQDTVGVAFWAPFALFFPCLAFLSFRQSLLRKWRFNLRTLLIGMTLVTLLLALFVSV